jgi:hypothetical protein
LLQRDSVCRYGAVGAHDGRCGGSAMVVGFAPVRGPLRG